MRALVLFLLLLPALALADAAFPIPSLDGKPTAASDEKGRVFQLPLGFAKVEQFYRERFKESKTVTLSSERTESGRVLKLSCRDKQAAWTRATVRETQTGTRVEIVPLLRADETQVEGNATPAVQFVLGRSGDAAKMAEDIDHSGR